MSYLNNQAGPPPAGVPSRRRLPTLREVLLRHLPEPPHLQAGRRALQHRDAHAHHAHHEASVRHRQLREKQGESRRISPGAVCCRLLLCLYIIINIKEKKWLLLIFLCLIYSV